MWHSYVACKINTNRFYYSELELSSLYKTVIVLYSLLFPLSCSGWQEAYILYPGHPTNKNECEFLVLIKSFHQTIFQYTDAGTYTCSAGERPYKIPGSYGHYDQDSKTYAEWGIECELSTHYSTYYQVASFNFFLQM